MREPDNTPAPRPYLVHVAPDGDIIFPAKQVCRLADGLYIVVSALTRSRLYHRIKREAPPGAALLVAPLADAPKFKGMSRGALAFTRRIWEPAAGQDG
ncbi:hypothetical protein [Brevundimonas sp.]|uniref:hypothetical protein n=1 Tax=Brevundimonas sp. TaxID=1871086 RepID=UPI001D9C06FD|nr:hypothetical protein [Brevundimonas sp.]MBA4000085.1 hypothetical protein [Brevundimonas sp.]